MNQQHTQGPWEKLFWRLAIELDCLPSSFAADNEHVFRKVAEIKHECDELQRINNLLFQEAYGVYTDACESAGHDPEPMEVWQPKYLRVIDRQAKAKAGA